MSVTTEETIDIIVNKINALASAETSGPEDLVYLSKALEAVGPTSAVLKVALEGTRQVGLVESAGSTALSSITDAKDEAVGTINQAVDAKLVAVEDDLVPVGAFLEVNRDVLMNPDKFIEADGSIYPRDTFPALDAMYPEPSMRVGERTRLNAAAGATLFATSPTQVVISGDGLTAFYYREITTGALSTFTQLFKRTNTSEAFVAVPDYLSSDMSVALGTQGIEAAITNDGRHIIVGGIASVSCPTVLTLNPDTGKYTPRTEFSAAGAATYVYHGGILTKDENYFIGFCQYNTTVNAFRMTVHPFDKESGMIGAPTSITNNGHFYGYTDLTMRCVQQGGRIYLAGKGSAVSTLSLMIVNLNTMSIESSGTMSIAGINDNTSSIYDVCPLKKTNDNLVVGITGNAGFRVYAIEITTAGIFNYAAADVSVLNMFGNSTTNRIQYAEDSEKLFLLPSTTVTTIAMNRFDVNIDGSVTFVGAMPPISAELIQTTGHNKAGSVTQSGDTILRVSRAISGENGLVQIQGEDVLEVPFANKGFSRNKVYIKYA